jgi:hypothetical protein
MKAPNISFHSELSVATVIHEMVGKEAVEAVEIDMDQRTVALIYPHEDMHEMAKLMAASVKMAEALNGLLPLAEWALGEQSPPNHSQALLDAATLALREAGYTD